jgi:hypothetical protein
VQTTFQAIGAGDPVGAGGDLAAAQRAYQEAFEKYEKYKDANFEGADTAVGVLKAVIVVDVAVGAALTGGAELGVLAPLAEGSATAATTVEGAGILTNAVATGAMGAEGAAITDAGDQMDRSKPFDWLELVGQSAGGFVGGFTSALISGPLKEMFTSRLTAVLSEKLADVLGVEVAVLEERVEKWLVEFGLDKIGELAAGKPMEYVLEELRKKARGGEPVPEPEEAVTKTVEQVAPTLVPILVNALK